jgi:hypothetical protein
MKKANMHLIPPLKLMVDQEHGVWRDKIDVGRKSEPL